MTVSRRRIARILGGSITAFCLSVSAQGNTAGNWPERPIRLIVPYPAGSHVDMLARVIANQAAKEMTQPIIVENKPGAGATLGTDYVAQAAPDGYTLLFAPLGAIVIAPHLKKLNYTASSFEPVAKVAYVYTVMAARKDAPFSNLEQLVKTAKANPGTYSYASNGVGSATHLVAAIINKAVGIDMLHVPYKGANEQLTDLMAGRVDVMYAPIGIARIRDGTLKGIVSISDHRLANLPDVPTLKEVAPNINISLENWFGILAPRGTPPEILRRFSAKLEQTLKDPALKERLQFQLSSEPSYEDQQRFAQRIQSDSEQFAALIKSENIRSD